MTSMLSDMLQSSLSKFASQFKLALEARESLCLHRMWLQFMRKAPRIRRINQRGVVNSEGDPADTQGIPRLDNMTEEEERDLDTFSLAPVTVPKRFWRAREDSKSHS